MILNPWAENRRLRAELTATEALLAEANRKLAAGGRMRSQRHRELVLAKAAELMEVVNR